MYAYLIFVQKPSMNQKIMQYLKSPAAKYASVKENEASFITSPIITFVCIDQK